MVSVDVLTAFVLVAILAIVVSSWITHTGAVVHIPAVPGPWVNVYDPVPTDSVM